MKSFLYGLKVFAIVFLVAGCRKSVETLVKADPALEVALGYLKSQMPANEYLSLDVSHATVLHDRQAKIPIVRLPITGSKTKSLTVVKTQTGFSANWIDLNGFYSPGRENVIRLEKLNSHESVELTIAEERVNKISRQTSTGLQVSTIIYEDGAARISTVGLESSKYLDPEEEISQSQYLPEFILTAILNNSSRQLFSLFWLTNMNPTYLFSYTFLDPFNLPGGSTPPNVSDPEPGESGEIIEVPQYEFETGPGIDLAKLLKCFDNVPSEGAKYSLTLYADIPVNNDVTQLRQGLSPGHSFIGMTKQNGNNSMTQIFGFYPTLGSMSLLGAAVKSKILDNSEHEYDASITLNDVDEYSFAAIRKLAGYYSNAMQYDINDFNCTNFAIDIFNLALPIEDKIVIDDWRATVFDMHFGTTPNGLYQYLSTIPQDGVHGHVQMGTSNAGLGNGACK